MQQYFLALAITFTALSHATAQALQFEAEVMPDGRVELVPKSTDAPAAADQQERSNGAVTSAVAHPDQLYLRMDETGNIEGAYTSEVEALAEPLKSGESIEAVEVVGTTAAAWGSSDHLREIAVEASKQLMQAAKDAACSFEPKPESVTPAVEVSFSILAGGTFSVSATWQTSSLCPD
jgi:hypothetical protein